MHLQALLSEMSQNVDESTRKVRINKPFYRSVTRSCIVILLESIDRFFDSVCRGDAVSNNSQCLALTLHILALHLHSIGAVFKCGTVQNYEKIIETPHPYLDNMDEEYHVHFPGASEIVISFDSNCRTEQRLICSHFVKLIVVSCIILAILRSPLKQAASFPLFI